jgi:hypothetical protein
MISSMKKIGLFDSSVVDAIKSEGNFTSVMIRTPSHSLRFCQTTGTSQLTVKTYMIVVAVPTKYSDAFSSPAAVG